MNGGRWLLSDFAESSVSYIPSIYLCRSPELGRAVDIFLGEMRKLAQISKGSSQGLIIHEGLGLQWRCFHDHSGLPLLATCILGALGREHDLCLQNEPQHLASDYPSALRMDMSLLARLALVMVKLLLRPQASGNFSLLAFSSRIHSRLPCIFLASQLSQKVPGGLGSFYGLGLENTQAVMVVDAGLRLATQAVIYRKPWNPRSS